jgi:transglutaminase-like putative cysteine protease
VLATSLVTVADVAPPAQEPAWETVRDAIHGPMSAELLHVVEYTLPSPRLAPHPDVAAYARPSFRAGRPLEEAAIDLSRRIFSDFRYVSGSSTVGSTVPELLERGEGVCQDFAHLAVAALRSAGLAARYVSGYLETTPPPGRERVLGADASHAWVSVYTGSRWLDLDPTNDRLVDHSYVELAHGRDYGDVPPLKGVIFSDSTESVMSVAVDMIPVGTG